MLFIHLAECHINAVQVITARIDIKLYITTPSPSLRGWARWKIGQSLKFKILDKEINVCDVR